MELARAYDQAHALTGAIKFKARTQELDGYLQHAFDCVEAPDTMLFDVLATTHARPAGNHTNGSVGRLTPQQGTVAALMAGGVTDRQIAERLNISLRTAEHHAGAVLTALNVEGRQQLNPAAITANIAVPRCSRCAGLDTALRSPAQIGL